MLSGTIRCLHWVVFEQAWSLIYDMYKYLDCNTR